MDIQDRYDAVLGWFEESGAPDKPELLFHDAFSLLVAVVLSAQCTDKRINMVTPALINAYPTAEKMAEATEEDLLGFIHSVSYPNSKARHLKALAAMLVEKFHGEVPSERSQLEQLPGVGRKTANVVLAVCFGKPTMAVDTHVFRVSNRIGLTNNSTSVKKTEAALTKHIPPDKIPSAHHWLILHGRYTCLARKPKCEICGLQPWCLYYNTAQNNR